ncbi:hypothetical protein GCM10007242_27760 [Pigmentiphaga litoralis]|uniref:hypothetical protein n=1 Tax=Pigmentiphaga litoralis TaxID=516702 RepID=UPI001673BA08|nr:hypothetical protein [Pigmentiphaga litoralis]GGX19355.1 hypothetical protein GCM10007242_27760 [Pigmentiphaga litoralis]
MDNVKLRNPFPTDVSEGLSHGTLECSDIISSRGLLRDFLGLQTLRHSQPSYTTWRGDPGQFIACVDAGPDFQAQGVENRWELSVESESDFSAAYEAAADALTLGKFRHVSAVTDQDGFPWFSIQDQDGNWWGISNRQRDWLNNFFDNGADL